MNKLQLFQRLKTEAGVSGNVPISTEGQTGQLGQLVNWIDTAYQDIQLLHDDWPFMQKEFSFETISGKANYTPEEAGITNLLKWKTNTYDALRCYKSASGVSNEQIIVQYNWDNFKRIFLIGNARNQTGRPKYYTIKPNNSILFSPTPDDVYTVNGEYFQTPDVFIDDNSEPIFPSQYHLAIVWRALMFFGAYESAQERYSHGQNEFKRILRKMERDRLPAITWGAPLV